MIFVIIGSMVLLWFLLIRGHTDPVEDFINDHVEDKTVSSELLTSVNEMSTEFVLPAKVIVSFMYAESFLEPRAKGDYVSFDYFGSTHFSSFGLGQINTSKMKNEQWSTFDVICEHYREHFIVGEYGLGNMIRRNSEVRLAINDGDSLLYDVRVNTFLTTGLLAMICDKKKIVVKTFDDLKQLARYYNAGMYTDMTQEEWEDIRQVYIENLKYAWDSMS